ncbi:hypothetical protein [Alteromonas macleodii]|nr:hypothetical protein [Alteromonas macleodii]|tara:strand:+ start:22267 stop:22758 length:492 start_codon:yes stop_codon:yes gene_type:complete
MNIYRQRGWISSFILFSVLASLSAYTAMKVMQIQPRQAASHSKERWLVVKHLATSANKYYKATCEVGVVSISDLVDAGFLAHDTPLPLLPNLQVSIENPGSLPFVQVSTDYESGNRAGFSDLLAHGAVEENGSIVFRQAINSPQSAIQRRVMSEQALFSMDNC